MKKLLLCLGLLCPLFTFAQISFTELLPALGPHQVGFQHYVSEDSTRTYTKLYHWNNQKPYRPIEVSIWYPADANNEKPMQILNYFEVLKVEEEWPHLPNEQLLNWFRYPNNPKNQAYLQSNTKAHLDAKSKEGKFPVVLYAPGYERSSIENFAICELLASHGYIVLASPSRGHNNKSLEGASLRDIETQARDLCFLNQEATKWPSADVASVAVMGYSLGGLSNILAQTQNARFDAIVSLDGSVKYNYPLLQKSSFFEIDKVNVPFIHMAQKEIPEEVLKEDKIDPSLNTDFDFFDELKNSDAYRLQFHQLSHPQFSTLGILFVNRDPRQDRPDQEIKKAYQVLSLYTLNFLNAHLKGEEKSKAFLKEEPDANILSIERKEAPKKAFSFQDFNEAAAQEGYKNLYLLWKRLKQEHPDLQLPEGQLNNLGLQLVFNPQSTANGIQVLELATQVYPKSANLFDSLAEAYLFSGNKEAAKTNFEKSLELYPQNTNAIQRLKELDK